MPAVMPMSASTLSFSSLSSPASPPSHISSSRSQAIAWLQSVDFVSSIFHSSPSPSSPSSLSSLSESPNTYPSSSSSSSSSSQSYILSSYWRPTGVVIVGLLLLGAVRLLLQLLLHPKKTDNSPVDLHKGIEKAKQGGSDFEKKDPVESSSESRNTTAFVSRHTPFLTPCLPALPADTAAQIINHYNANALASNKGRRSRRVYQLSSQQSFQAQPSQAQPFQSQPFQAQPFSHRPFFPPPFTPFQPFRQPLCQHAVDRSRGISRASEADSSRGPLSTADLPNIGFHPFNNPLLPPLPLSTSSRAPADADVHFAMASSKAAVADSGDASQSLSFIHQPNPDYGTDTATTADTPADNTSSEAATEADPWMRHTRVYGGGVCLACQAAESRGAVGVGYGDAVPLEMRK